MRLGLDKADDALGLAGTGLRILPRYGPRSIAIAVGAGLAFGTYMALADATVFANAVPAVQHKMLASTGTAQRILIMSVLAAIDELKLRLVVMTALVWLFTRVGVRGPSRFWLAIIGVALLVYPLATLGYFSTLDWSAEVAVRELALHGAAGVLWGWLYWRHGWTAGLLGHVAAHFSLQLMLAML